MARAKLIPFPVVDGHFHLWDRSENPYPWLEEGSPRPALGDHRRLMRSVLLEDYLAEMGSLLDVAGVVHVEAGCGDPLAETRWIERVATSSPLPLVHVARVALPRPGSGKAVAALAEHAIVRGVRMRLNADPRIAGRPGIADEPEFRRRFAAIDRSGRLFELSLYPPQAGEGVRIAQAFPGTSFVLNHLGWPRIGEGLDRFETWQQSLRRLARCKNMTIKLSML